MTVDCVYACLEAQEHERVRFAALRLSHVDAEPLACNI